jgi:ABC-type branched-subunit amino acid transport system ATPase component
VPIMVEPGAGMEHALSVVDLHLAFGRARILHGVSLSLTSGALSVVGRNGMGKTTLCQSIMGLLHPSSGAVRIFGRDMVGKQPNVIARHGVGYVPQGRRVWPSLSVDEHLRLAQRRANARWTVEGIYDLFPRLAERRNNGGAQLSGGEQQMLAIGRALLVQPRLLIMDEPTEGLAPVIVDQVVKVLQMISREEAISILLIEQNLSVACAVSDQVAVMVNGQISEIVPSRLLATDSAVQQRVLFGDAGKNSAAGAAA